MVPFSLGEMLSRVGVRMADELSDQLVEHRGEQGVAREVVVRDFLRAQLPTRFEVSSGFVFDAHGAVSAQLDVIIADAFLTPRFEVARGVRYFPCEGVVAVGQVKTQCDSRRKIWEALVNLRSVGELDRSARGRAVSEKTGEVLDHTSNHLDRVFTFLFVIDNALSADAVQELLFEYVTRSEQHLWPSVILALNKYLATYCCDDGVCPNTVRARGIALVTEDERNNTLLQFYAFLSEAVLATRVSRMSSWAHLRECGSLTAEVVYAATDDPPPFLASLPSSPWCYPYDD